VKQLKKIFLCELLSKYDGSRQIMVAFRSEKSARQWRDNLNAFGVGDFSAADKLGCVPVIKELEVRP